MATIYRIIAEQQASGGGSSGGRKNTKKPKGAGKAVSLLSYGGKKGGVEHNRYMRAINPVINQATHGYWEKGTRVGRAALGLVRVNSETGAFAGLSGTAMTIIISFILLTLLKWQSAEREKAQKMNAQNYKALENGVGQVHSAYEVSTNFWTGRQTYNQNK